MSAWTSWSACDTDCGSGPGIQTNLNCQTRTFNELEDIKVTQMTLSS